MKFFKFEAEGDTVYVKDADQAAAKSTFSEHIGEVPESLLTTTEIQEADKPEDEVWLGE